MGTVFISYRRDDSGSFAHLLAGRLMTRLGKRNVFLDVDSIAGGELFPQRLEQALRASDLVLVLIGPRWLTIRDERGMRRLEQPGDFVRREVEGALLSGKPVVPLLLDGAAMPAAGELPPGLQRLAACQPLTSAITSSASDARSALVAEVQRRLLMSELRRSPAIAFPLLAALMLAVIALEVPYVAMHGFGHSLLGAGFDALNEQMFGFLVVIVLVLGAWHAVRGRLWGWLIALALLLVVSFGFPAPFSYRLLLPPTLCLALFSVLGPRISRHVALLRLSRAR